MAEEDIDEATGLIYASFQAAAAAANAFSRLCSSRSCERRAATASSSPGYTRTCEES